MHTGDVKRVMIFIDETDRWHGHNLTGAIIDRVRKEGCAGATVLRGSVGFGVHGQVHTTAIVDLSVNLPVLILIIDDIEKIDRILPILQEMVTEGLIIVDEVQAIRRNGLTGKPDKQTTSDAGQSQHIVAEYMDESPVVVSAETKVDEIIKQLIENHRAHLPVVTRDRILLGMVSAQDLLAKLVHTPQGPFKFFFMQGTEKQMTAEEIKALASSDVMQTHFASVEPETPMVRAVQIMLHERLSAMPVVKEHKLVGILRLPDLLEKALAIEGRN